MGHLRDKNLRDDFPELTGRVAELYKTAFGEEVYKEYPDRVNATADLKNTKKLPHIRYRRQGFHDVESLYWVLKHELVSVCPEGKDE